MPSFDCVNSCDLRQARGLLMAVGCVFGSPHTLVFRVAAMIFRTQASCL
jgi:hypothetical protein